MKKPRSYLLLAVLASGVLWWVFDLSSSGRGPVDWIVVGVVIAAILWSLYGLGRRLLDVGGGKAVWHELRTLMFWLVGLMNTVWARPGAGGTWKWWVGIVLLLLAAADTIALYLKEQRWRPVPPSPHGNGPRGGSEVDPVGVGGRHDQGERSRPR